MLNKQFLGFLDRLSKESGQKALCEAVKEGYKVCCESITDKNTHITVGKYDVNEGDSGRPCIWMDNEDGTEVIFTEDDPNVNIPEGCTLLCPDIDYSILVDNKIVAVLGMTWADPNSNGGCKHPYARVLVSDGNYEVTTEGIKEI